MVVMPLNFSCGLATREDLRSIRVGTNEHTFGFFIFQTDSSGVIEPYWPFLNNLANYVALSLENRLQKLLLEKARDELEDKVKKRTEDLRQMNERFSLAARAANLGVWDWDIQKNELVWDDRMYELYGLKREDFSGAYEAWLKGVHPDDRASSDEISKQAQRGERAYDTEFRVVWPDHSIHYLKAYGQFVRDGAGKPLRMIGINYDITDRKRAEEQIRKLNQELEQRVLDRTAQLEAANKELETFSYSVSHDLRAPLRAISGFTAILARRHRANLNDEGQHYLDNIMQAGERMEQLIDNLLAYSRLGRAGVQRGPVPLRDIFTPLVEEFAERLKEIDGTLEIADDLPAVMGDKTLLTQIFTNLLDNALTYRRADVPVQVTVTPQTEDKTVIIRICDNGIGIAPEYYEKIFNIFQRLHSEDEYPGTGIGLATVKKSVEMLGGCLWVESEVGKGSTFFIKLPKE